MYRGIYTAPPTAGEGMQMVYVPDRQVIRMEGWHSNRQGTLHAVEMPLADFLNGLGITLADCQTVLHGDMAQPQMSVTGQPARRAASEVAPERQQAVPSQSPPRAA